MIAKFSAWHVLSIQHMVETKGWREVSGVDDALLTTSPDAVVES